MLAMVMLIRSFTTYSSTYSSIHSLIPSVDESERITHPSRQPRWKERRQGPSHSSRSVPSLASIMSQMLHRPMVAVQVLVLVCECVSVCLSSANGMYLLYAVICSPAHPFVVVLDLLLLLVPCALLPHCRCRCRLDAAAVAFPPPLRGGSIRVRGLLAGRRTGAAARASAVP